ncbi:MAG: peptidoglycan bridge formation glycyltransferase FemA/FemB family protein [Planctomycetota bacterium]
MYDLAVEGITLADWRRCVTAFADYNYRQLPAFDAACAARFGAHTELLAMGGNAQPVALASVRIRPVAFVGGLAYVAGGPLVCRTGVPDRGRVIVAVLHALARRYCGERGLLLRVSPNLAAAGYTAAFAETGFRPAVRARDYRTLVVSLTRPLPDIRTSLDQKWRNCLNRAERNGLVLRSSTDHAAFAEFCLLFDDMRKRKWFDVELDSVFYARVQEQLEHAERFCVTLAEHEGRPVAGHVMSALGDTAVYLLGATNANGLELKASYLLQWHALKTAQDFGCTWYDLGGIDPDNNPGVYHFKRGLAGGEVSVPGPMEQSASGISAKLLLAAECVLRRARELRRRTVSFP